MSALPTDTTQWLALRAHVEPECVRPGERGVLVVEAEIPPGCHIEAHEPSEPFLVPAELRLDPVEGVTVGPVRYPAAEEKRFAWSPAVLRVYQGSIRFEAQVEIITDAAAGPRVIRGRLQYQGCTPAACLMPATQLVEAELEINSEKSRNGKKTPEGKGDANPR
jgi:Disulphide bond corrector protein DsbC